MAVTAVTAVTAVITAVPVVVTIALTAVTAVQACHELVTPETLHPLLQTLVHHFVSDKSRPEMVAIGLNTAREVCPSTA